MQLYRDTLKFVGGDESEPCAIAVFPGGNLANIATHEVHVSITFDEQVSTEEGSEQA